MVTRFSPPLAVGFTTSIELAATTAGIADSVSREDQSQ
jgi:hypothetical protein